MKLHKKYEPFIKHNGRFSIITGGRGSGKSFAVSQFIIKLTFEEGHKIQMLRRNRNASDDSTIALVHKMISDLELDDFFVIYKNSITNKLSGSQIIFDGVTANNKEATARNKGKAGFTTIVFEEAEEFTDASEFNKINLGLREDDKDLRIILLLNPTTKEHWIYKRFFAKAGVNAGFNGVKDDVCYVHTTYLDIKKHLNKSTIKEIEWFKENDPDYYQHAILGGWLEKSEGAIFKNWEYGQFPDEQDTYFGADWGYSNDPATLIEVFVNKTDRVIYLKEHLYKKGLSSYILANIFKSRAGDKLIFADSADGRLIDEIKSYGVNIKRCTKGRDSIKNDIALIQDYKLIVDNASKNLAIELDNYEWNTRTEKPVDKYNHLMDAMRYVLKELINPNKHTGVYHFY